MKLAWQCALSAIVLAAVAQPVSAQSAPPANPGLTADEKARELFLQGDRLYAEGSYHNAVRAFKRAYELSARPALLFNIANALERLGRYEEALQYLHRFAPDAPEHQRHIVLKRIQAIERLADAQRPSDPAPRVQQPQPASASAVPPAPQAPVLPADSSSPRATTGYALVGVGSLAIVAGTFAAFSASSSHDVAAGACRAAEAGSTLCPDSAQSSLDKERSSALLADVGWAVGAAALGVGLYLVLDAPTGDGTSTHLSISANDRGGRLNFVTRF